MKVASTIVVNSPPSSTLALSIAGEKDHGLSDILAATHRLIVLDAALAEVRAELATLRSHNPEVNRKTLDFCPRCWLRRMRGLESDCLDSAFRGLAGSCKGLTKLDEQDKVAAARRFLNYQYGEPCGWGGKQSPRNRNYVEDAFIARYNAKQRAEREQARREKRRTSLHLAARQEEMRMRWKARRRRAKR